MKIKTILVFSFSVLLVSCAKENLEDIELANNPKVVVPTSTTPISNCDTANTITYTGVVSSIMTTSCGAANSSCHDNTAQSGGYDLSTYSAVSTSADNPTFINSINRCCGASSMPRGADKLDACTISKISKWIRTGKQQ